MLMLMLVLVLMLMLMLMLMLLMLMLMTMRMLTLLAGLAPLSESVQKGRGEGARLLGLKIYRHFLDKTQEKIARTKQARQYLNKQD